MFWSMGGEIGLKVMLVTVLVGAVVITVSGRVVGRGSPLSTGAGFAMAIGAVCFWATEITGLNPAEGFG